MAIPLWVTLATLEFVVLGVFTAWLVKFYAAKTAPMYALAMVFFAWYLGFFGILFLPIDIAEAYANTFVNVTNVTEIVYEPVNGTGGGEFPWIYPSLSLSPSPSPGWMWPADNSSAVGNGTEIFSLSPSASGNASVTATPSPTGTNWTAVWSSASGTGSGSATVSVTRTLTPSLSPTPSKTTTRTASGSNTPTPTSTITRSRTLSATKTPTPSKTRVVSKSVTPSRTPGRASPSPSRLPSNADCEGGCGRLLEGEDESVFAPIARLLGSLFFGESPLEPSSVPRLGLRALQDGGSGSSGGSDAQQSPPVEVVAYDASTSGGDGSAAGNETAGWSSSVTPSPSPSPLPPNVTAEVAWELDEETVVLRNGPLERMWMTVYWITFLLTYIIIPVTQEYLAAGQFSFRGKLCASLQVNIIWYAMCGLIAFGALAYVIIGLQQDIWALLPVLISLANTYGLIIVVVALGYGAAEVPRAIWRRSDPEGELRRLYFKAPEADGVVFDAKNSLQDLVKDIDAFAEKLGDMQRDKDFKTGENAAKLHALLKAFVTVKRKKELAVKMLGKAYKPRAERRAKSAAEIAAEEEEEEEYETGLFSKIGGVFTMGGGNKYKGINVGKLAKLHKKLMVQMSSLIKEQHRFDSLVLRCIELEFQVAKAAPPVPVKKATAEGGTYYLVPKGAMDLSEIRQRGAGMGATAPPRRRTAPPPGGDENHDVLSQRAGEALLSLLCCPRLFNGFFNRAMWRFKIYANFYFFKVVYLLAECMSLLLLWCEATIWVNLAGLVPDNLSVFGMLLQMASEAGHYSYFAIQLASLLPLLYMCATIFYATFKLKVFNYVDLSGNGNTDPYSLLVNSSLMNRLQFSLAFNYLNVLMHSKNKRDFPDTAFLNSVGAQMTLSVVDWYLPLVAVLIYVICKLNLFDRMLRKIGMAERGEPTKGNADHEQSIADGRAVVQRARVTLGLSDDGLTEEQREKQAALSRDRFQAVLARMEARRQGKNPDDVAPLADGMGLELVPGAGADGAGAPVKAGAGVGDYASGGDPMSSTKGMLSLDQFAATQGGAAGGAAPFASPGRLGLAALASKFAVGKSGAASSSSGAGGAADGAGPAGDDLPGATSYGVVDHGDDDDFGAASAAGGARGAGSSGAGAAGRGVAASAPAAPPPPPPSAPLEPPPTMAELLRGTKKPPKLDTPAKSASAAGAATPQRGASALAQAAAARSPLPGGGVLSHGKTKVVLGTGGWA